MSDFILNQKLENDCIVLGKIRDSLLLLMNNALVPWFIIVPETTKLEIHLLSNDEQTELYANINALSEFIKQQYKVDKLNVASIGNVVSQMHIHVIGRSHNDYCWPDVVWGRPERVEYTSDQIRAIVDGLKTGLKNCFVQSGSHGSL
ncbi:HIT domain-containing protein [Kaarinaea lacus]